ncbi:hypothetical protein FDP41_005504 [Naegleria fowleri]|uniref:Phospholipase/carboxylesterase/thioesterase domain-containing protein n=1 Tax=Naegleria fowleri TaxID=5763 RepID=A0A6A5BMU1_NAEFO|nr:uncharacterized protein FDP41_005671 [Naegleria fowleri]XP_044560223.1 uncharacterized protein FDP41_005504 [Naegleria fowleri]KAF0975300.1 hypothetical protein FDP41_005671 [Naegleria fowleri]KAF0975510.1 hypothetical protein FDP41_005504 [Naegleria fowleri]
MLGKKFCVLSCRIAETHSSSSFRLLIRQLKPLTNTMKNYHKIHHTYLCGMECAVLTPSSIQHALSNNHHHQTSSVNSAVIWLHGLGDTYDGFAQMLQHVLPNHTIGILPNAPHRPITINGGMVMPGWYDIQSLDRQVMKVKEDIEGYHASKKLVNDLIHTLMTNDDEFLKQHLIPQIPSNRIVLGGFSQGGAMSVLVGSQCKYPLAGIVCASGYVLLRSQYSTSKEFISQENISTPLYIFHGDEDDVVNYQNFAKQSFDWLEEGGKMITQRKIYRFHSHEVSEEEMRDLKNTFSKLLN